MRSRKQEEVNMSTATRLTEVFEGSSIMEYSESDNLIIFSDCHRGDNTWADDFAHNQMLLFHALNHYFDRGFTYIELGDGDELWENADFSTIRRAHSHIFWQIQRFHNENRFHMIFGNHDIEKSLNGFAERHLSSYYDEKERDAEDREKEFLPGVKIHEGIRLRFDGLERDLFLVHGHQGDFLNDKGWRIGRWGVRHIWRHLQLLGIADPTRAAVNYRKRVRVETKIKKWIDENNQPLVAGHTHRPRFPYPGDSPFFNDGSCVHPRCITGIEITGGSISLIKWWTTVDDHGMLQVAREVLEGPRGLREFLI
jgi:predicted phosphodiesterase